MPPQTTWAGYGAWAADKHGPPATFVQSLGLGNAIDGEGVLIEGGTQSGRWSLAAQALPYRDPDGGKKVTLHQGHLTYTTLGEWRWGLEKEPLVWGYGLNGGYLLGNAATPFPRLRMETPLADLHIFRVPLGAWKGQIFLGRLEADRPVGEESQDPSYRNRAIASRGQPEAPYLSGFRGEARFGPNVEFYLNWINLFGGTLNGVSQFSGYGFGDYLTAFTGTKDTLAEANLDQTNPGDKNQAFPYVNKARSASNADVGIRVRLPGLEDRLHAEDVRVYLSRGSKAVNFNYGLVQHHPRTYVLKDGSNDLEDIRALAPDRIYDRTQRYLAPTLQVPNDNVGMVVNWAGFRLGLEYLDTVNQANQFGGRPVEGGHRSFEHENYLSGFYYEGDPLGTALGGEARYVTLRLEWDLTSRLTLQTWVQSGQRPFRDDPASWALDHPGQTPVTNRFTGMQEVVTFGAPLGWNAGAGASFQHQSAVLNVQGAPGNGFRWFLQAGRRWSLR